MSGQFADTEPSAWDGPHRSAARDSAPILSVEGFEDPLDWLLEMVRARQIDLAKLSILALVTEFATALEAALAGRDRAAGEHVAPLGRWGDWLVMASNLALLHSRLLLPADAAEARAAADEADLWRRQFIGRAEMRAAADWLERQPQLQRDMFRRSHVAAHRVGRVGDITALLRACLGALKLPEGSEAYPPETATGMARQRRDRPHRHPAQPGAGSGESARGFSTRDRRCAIRTGVPLSDRCRDDVSGGPRTGARGNHHAGSTAALGVDPAAPPEGRERSVAIP